MKWFPILNTFVCLQTKIGTQFSDFGYCFFVLHMYVFGVHVLIYHLCQYLFAFHNEFMCLEINVMNIMTILDLSQ
jgi:hypothetical protein